MNISFFFSKTAVAQSKTTRLQNIALQIDNFKIISIFAISRSVGLSVEYKD